METQTILYVAAIVFLIVIYFHTRPNEMFRRLGPKFYTILVNDNEATPEMCNDNLLVQNTPGLRDWCLSLGLATY